MCVLTDSLAIDVQETCNRALSLQHELDVVRGKYDRLLAAAKAVMCDDKAHRNAIFESSGVARNWCKFEAAIREAEEGKA